MDTREMAEILYSACVDMDFGDYVESYDEDVTQLATEIENLDKDSALYKGLEIFTTHIA